MTRFLVALIVATPTAAVGQMSPRLVPPGSGVSQWTLGAVVDAVPHGARVLRVGPGTAAARNGIEPGDVIATVNGRPVGFVNGRFIDLEDQLNQSADRFGRVTLRVRNVRTGRLTTIPVQLDPVGGGFPGGGFPGGNWPGPGPGPGLPGPGFPGGGFPGGGFPGGGQVGNEIAGFYLRYLGRPANPAEVQHWINEMVLGMSLLEVEARILASDEYFDRNQNNLALWIGSLYLQKLGRPARPDEVAGWAGRFGPEFFGNRLALTRTFLIAAQR